MCSYSEIGAADQILSDSCSVLTPSQPVPALTLQRQMIGRVDPGVPIVESLVHDLETDPRPQWSAALEADIFNH